MRNEILAFPGQSNGSRYSLSETHSYPVIVELRISAVDYFSRSNDSVQFTVRDELLAELSALFERLREAYSRDEHFWIPCVVKVGQIGQLYSLGIGFSMPTTREQLAIFKEFLQGKLLNQEHPLFDTRSSGYGTFPEED